MNVRQIIVEQIVDEYLERHEQNDPETLERIVAQTCCPELLAEVNQLVAKADEADIGDTPPQVPPQVTMSADYVDLVELSRGGLGIVCEARDPHLSRRVAIKIPLTDTDPGQGYERFQREVELTARLNHPGIVPVYARGQDRFGRPCYAMQLVSGETLYEAIGDLYGNPASKHTLYDLLERFIAVCYTVAYAHGQGVVHRDLKPANIMLGAFGNTYVVDWGCAKSIGIRNVQRIPPWLVVLRRLVPPAVRHVWRSFRSRYPAAAGVTIGHIPITENGLTQSSLGTDGYMCPDQQAHPCDAEFTWDVYSLGVTLREILTGVAPTDEGRSMAASTSAERDLRQRVPRSLRRVVRKATDRRPAKRYQSALALARHLEMVLRSVPPADGSGSSLTLPRRTLVTRFLTVVLSICGVIGLDLLAIAGIFFLFTLMFRDF